MTVQALRRAALHNEEFVGSIQVRHVHIMAATAFVYGVCVPLFRCRWTGSWTFSTSAVRWWS